MSKSKFDDVAVFCVSAVFFHFPRVALQCFGGVTIFDKAVLSALIVLPHVRYDVSSPHPAPTQSLSRKFVMRAFV